jgi:hypothetical protein
MANLEETLEERGKRYGRFTDHAQVTQDLKRVAANHLRSTGLLLAADQQEALDMIFHKIARIVCGDPNYADSWHDIAGYAKLVEDRLNAGVVSRTQLDNGWTRVELADGFSIDLPPYETAPTSAAPICPSCSCAVCGTADRWQNDGNPPTHTVIRPSVPPESPEKGKI